MHPKVQICMLHAKQKHETAMLCQSEFSKPRFFGITRTGMVQLQCEQVIQDMAWTSVHTVYLDHVKEYSVGCVMFVINRCTKYTNSIIIILSTQSILKSIYIVLFGIWIFIEVCAQDGKYYCVECMSETNKCPGQWASTVHWLSCINKAPVANLKSCFFPPIFLLCSSNWGYCISTISTSCWRHKCDSILWCYWSP